MKKKILMIILVIILIKIVVLSVMTITNKTFYKKYYEVENSSSEKVKLPLPLFSYYLGEKDLVATLITLKSVKKVAPILNKYVENLHSCYDEGYFYDKDLDITISRYYVEDGFPFNKIYLNYEKGNRCEDEFVLDDDWMTDVIKSATVDKINIDQCTVDNNNVNCNTKTIKDIKEVLNLVADRTLVRIDNNKNIGEDVMSDYYLISGYYTLNNHGYTLFAFNHKDNLAFKVTDADDHSKNAIYDIDTDINELFKDIYDNYAK